MYPILHPSLVLRTGYRTALGQLGLPVLVWSLPVEGRGPEDL